MPAVMNSWVLNNAKIIAVTLENIKERNYILLLNDDPSPNKVKIVKSRLPQRAKEKKGHVNVLNNSQRSQKEKISRLVSVFCTR
jgi:hypothetical protein